MEPIAAVLPRLFDTRGHKYPTNDLPDEIPLDHAWQLSSVQHAWVCGHWVPALVLLPHLVDKVGEGIAQPGSSDSWPHYACLDDEGAPRWELRGDVLSLY